MKTIGKYVIRGLLGKGGMSVVYKARLPFVERIVALKLLAPHPNLVSLLGPESVKRQFIAEAARIASLHHPNVVDILDFDFTGDIPFFTMEYFYLDLGHLIGESYRTDLPCRILNLDKTIHYLRQILFGLSRLYRAGMVHRDIKPGNILITGDDRIKICDFGFSKLRGEKLSHPSQLLIGSPFYAAPEQERDPDGVDQRADIYSAGVIAHRMLTGLLPEDGIRMPSEYHPEADEAWDDFVRKALQTDPENRFTTPGEMLTALEELGVEWERKKTDFCRLFSRTPARKQPTSIERCSGKPRSSPVKAAAGQAASIFGCNELMHPLHQSEKELVCSDGETVSDSCNGLVWQRSGSEDPLDRKDADKYIALLNEQRFCGSSQWRLPTVDELFSILDRPEFGTKDCIPPAFDRTQKVLWSSDRCTFVSGWYVNMEIGFAGFADFTCHFHVRAVREDEEDQELNLGKQHRNDL
ncbi:MAG: DUF1566 domain-containing protein [Syntrophobacteraceae bacterium]